MPRLARSHLLPVLMKLELLRSSSGSRLIGWPDHMRSAGASVSKLACDLVAAR